MSSTRHHTPAAAAWRLGTREEEGDPQRGLRRLAGLLRRHVRHLPAGPRPGTGLGLLQGHRSVRWHQLDHQRDDLRGHAARPPRRRRSLRPSGRPDRPPPRHHRGRERLRHRHPDHRRAPRLRHLGDDRRRTADPAQVPGRGLPRRRVHQRDPARAGTLAQAQARAQRRAHHDRVSARVLHGRGDHLRPAQADSGRRPGLSLRPVGLAHPVRHRRAAGLRVRLVVPPRGHRVARLGRGGREEPGPR